MKDQQPISIRRRMSGSSGQINFDPFFAANTGNNFALAPKLKIKEKRQKPDFIQKNQLSRLLTEKPQNGNKFFSGMRQSTKVFHRNSKPSINHERRSYVNKKSTQRSSLAQQFPMENSMI